MAHRDYDYLLAQKNWAVVGVSEDQENFAQKIYFALKKTGHNVYAINPRREEFLGEPCYSSVAALPVVPDVVNVVVRPQVGMGVVEEAARLGVKAVWLQPGANAPPVADRGRELGLIVVDEACVLSELAKSALFESALPWD
jgi:predicted CoA-binding protein